MPRPPSSGSLGTRSLVVGGQPFLGVVGDPGVKPTGDLALNYVDVPHGTN